jgi:hypothetical protein
VDLFYFQLKNAEQTVPGTASFDSRSSVPGATVSTRSSEVDFPKTLIHVIGLTADIRARARLLKDDTYTNGRLQPYIGIAPGVFFGIIDEPDTTEVSDAARQAGLRPSSFRSTYSAPTWSYTWPGVKANAGVSFNITSWLAPFVEYRFIYLYAERERDGVLFKGDFLTHHVVGGLSFRF